jgi:hypothetical protein
MTDPRRPTSVDFDPVPLRPSGHRRFDPAVIGALVVATAVALAVVKPWDGSDAAGSADPGGARAPSPLASGASAVPVFPAAATDPDEAVRLLSVLQPRDRWGVQAVTARPGQPDLAGRWVPTETPGRAGGPELTTSLEAADQDVLALGVTTPRTATPLAIRAYALGVDGEPRWLETRRVASHLPAAELLLLPPAKDGVPAGRWPAGRYRLDLLMGTWIQTVTVELDTDETAAPPAPSEPPRGPDEAAMPPAWLGNVPTGVFTVVDGVVRPLAGEPGPRLDPAEAWLDHATHGGTRPPGVAMTPHADVARVGVMLPAGAHDASGVLRPLTPGTSANVRLAQTGARVDASNNPTAFLLFRAPEGTAWPAGFYALEATWVGPGGPQAAIWHLELTPGPAEDRTNLMSAAGVFSPFAGRDGLLIGTTEQLRDPDQAATLQPRAIEVDPSRGGTSMRTIGCDDADIDARPPVIGLAHPVDLVPSSIEAVVLGPFERSTAVRLRTAIDVVPGLSLVAPERGSAFPDGVYRITIRDATGVRAVRVCIGTSPFDG